MSSSKDSNNSQSVRQTAVSGNKANSIYIESITQNNTSERSFETPIEKEELLDRYLQWLIEQNRDLELPNLPESAPRPVELETVYVALRGDLSNSYERKKAMELLEEQAQQLNIAYVGEELSPDEEYKSKILAMMSLVANAPIPISLQERDRPHLFDKPNQKIVSLGEAFQKERRLVILGDPGSGKTTLCRWLTVKFVQANDTKQEKVLVPLNHVDPSADETDEVVNLGFTRIPILLRVASFANTRQENPQLRLVQFLGHHLGNAYGSIVADIKGREISPNQLNELFLELLELGKVVLLFDGLDEIANPTSRLDIVREIDNFIEEFVDNDTSYPYENGGNQVIITSRIVGYQMASLSKQSTHLTIEPMSKQAINRFCDVWIKAINKVSLTPENWTEQAETAARKEASELKEAIADLQLRGASDLASNPLLVTILALVFRNSKNKKNKASFPQQRVKLYEIAIDILVDKWRKRSQLNGEKEFYKTEVIQVLIPLAAQIHENSNLGVIDEKELVKVLKQYFSDLEVKKFQRVIKEEVGLLTARGEGIYGFLHLTFQEYLAGRWLIQNPEKINEQLLDKLSSPRWREPILMAIGQLSSELEEIDFQNLLLAMLDREDSFDKLIPRTVLLIVAALPEIVKVPNQVIEKLAVRIIEAYAKRDIIENFPSLKTTLEQAFLDISQEQHLAVIKRVLVKVLKTSEYDEQMAAASLMRIASCYNLKLVKELNKLWEYDSEEWNWAIDSALRDVAIKFPDYVHQPRSLRHQLRTKPELKEKFLANQKWIRLGITIYGGLDTSIAERIAEAKEKIAEIGYEQSGDTFNQSEETKERLSQEREKWDKILKNLKENGSIFAVDRMYRDSSILTPLIISSLEKGNSPNGLISQLWKKWESLDSLDNRANKVDKIDICLALAALGEQVIPILQEETSIAHKIIPHISKLSILLENAVQSASSSVTKSDNSNFLRKSAETIPIEHWMDLFRATLDLRLKFQGELLNAFTLEELVENKHKHLILTEALQYYFSGAGDDPIYNLAVVLDTVGGELSNPPIKLAKALANSCYSTNGKWEEHVGWSWGKILPSPTSTLDILILALDSLTAIPDAFDFFRGWIIVQLAPLLQENGLLVEATIIAVGSLSNRFNTRQETVELLINLQDNLDGLFIDPYPEFKLFQTVKAVENPYLRFLGYIKLIKYFPYLFQIEFKKHEASEAYSLITFAEKSAHEITEVRYREWAFEKLSQITALRESKQWLQLAIQEAEEITNIENRSRAYARLSTQSSLEEGLKLLLLALKDIEKISDSRKKTENIILFRKLLNQYPQANTRFKEIVGSLDVWNQAKALGFNAPLFLQYETKLEGNENIIASLTLGAILSDFRFQLSLSDNLNELWSALLSKRKAAAVESLYLQAKQKRLILTQEAIAILDILIKEGDIETVSKLLPLVQNPNSRSIQVLENWIVYFDVFLQKYIYLLIAEAGKFTKQSISVLIDLLNDEDNTIDVEDITRYRAALALHGDNADSMPLLKTTILGLDVLLELGKNLISYEQKPVITLTIGWTFERIYHNYSQILDNLIKIAKSNSVDSQNALCVLKKLNHIDLNIWNVIFKELKTGNFEVCEALVHSFCIQMARKRVPDNVFSEVLSIFKSSDLENYRNYEFILDGAIKIVESADSVLSSRKSSSVNLDLASESENIFLTKKQSLTDILRENDLNILKNHFISIGNLNIVNKSFKERIDIASTAVEQKPQLLEVLIDWLENKLCNVPFEDKINRLMTGDLLDVVAASAERLPNTFYNKALKSDSLRIRLVEVVENHNTFPGRQAALVLLSYLYDVTEETTDAFKIGLRDVVEVQDIAIQTIERYREIDSDFIEDLYEDLYNSSPATAFITAQILKVIAINVYLNPHLREEIIDALIKAIDDKKSKRDVYLLIKKEISYGQYIYQIEHKGQLNTVFYDIVVQLSGIEDLGKHNSKA